MKSFRCAMFRDPAWNAFVEEWAPRIYSFVGSALVGFYVEPLPDILPVPDADHSAAVNASFASNGQIRLSSYMEGDPGVTLEKLTHEMIHAALAAFPEGDPFWEEGASADYCTWLMAHSTYWEPHREAMIEAAANNIRNRRDRALKVQSDYDAKRWAGGLFASVAYGPYAIERLRHKKLTGDLTW